MIAANRSYLAQLVATNIFGQNTSAIAATEAQYGEMWAQDAEAMDTYFASSATASNSLAAFEPAPKTTNGSGTAAQASRGQLGQWQFGRQRGGNRESAATTPAATPGHWHGLPSSPRTTRTSGRIC